MNIFKRKDRNVGDSTSAVTEKSEKSEKSEAKNSLLERISTSSASSPSGSDTPEISNISTISLIPIVSYDKSEATDVAEATDVEISSASVPADDIKSSIESLQSKSEEFLRQTQERLETMSQVAQSAQDKVDELASKESEFETELERNIKMEREAKEKQDEISQRIEQLQQRIKLAQESARSAHKDLDATLAAEAEAIATLEAVPVPISVSETLSQLEGFKPIFSKGPFKTENIQPESKSVQERSEPGEPKNVTQIEGAKAETRLDETSENILSQDKERLEALSSQDQDTNSKATQLLNRPIELKSELELAIKQEREAKQKQVEIRHSLEQLQEELRLAQRDTLIEQRDIGLAMAAEAKEISTLETIKFSKNETLQQMESFKSLFAQRLVEFEDAYKRMKSVQEQIEKDLEVTVAAEARELSNLETIKSSKNETLQQMESFKSLFAQRLAEFENAQQELRSVQEQIENASPKTSEE